MYHFTVSEGQKSGSGLDWGFWLRDAQNVVATELARAAVISACDWVERICIQAHACGVSRPQFLTGFPQSQ